MRCKRHTIDFSSTIGVCASCLRERLISIAASTAASETEDPDHHHHSHSIISPPPLLFPRSVSPYVAPRKSVENSFVPSTTLLFATPQVGSTCNVAEKVFVSERSFKKRLSRFSNFFRTRSADYDKSSLSTFLSPSSSSSSTTKSWLSKVLKSKKQSYIEDLLDSESDNNNNNNINHRPRQRYCRGMSPAGDIDGEEEHRRTPIMGTPLRKTTTTMTTTMRFCLSPLVRAKPNNNSSNIWKGNGYSGELRSPVKPHISTAASFCGNRSKKLVDLGRVDPRR